MKFEVVTANQPFRQVAVIEAPTHAKARQQAAQLGNYIAVPIRETAGQSVRLMEQAPARMELQPAIEAARQLLRASEAFNPDAGDRHHFNAVYPYGLPVDSLEFSSQPRAANPGDWR